VIAPTRFALETPAMQRDYDACWSNFPKARLPGTSTKVTR
jgi:homogentisate 1,2-dioxygenase